MEGGGGGGCCLARLAGGYGVSQVDRIMLRFRPIAPKPETGSGSVPGCCSSVHKESRVAARGRAQKRRLGGEGRRGRKKRVTSEEEQAKKWPEDELVSGVIDAGKEEGFRAGNSSGFSEESVSSELVTLPLFVENPCRKISPASSSSSADSVSGGRPDLMLSHHLCTPNTLLWFDPIPGGSVPREQRVAVPQPVRPVGSSVTVECVTDTWLDRTLEGTLETDRLPGFVSDSGNRVRWVNRAYRVLVGETGGECMVGLWRKVELPEDCGGFTCWVRLRWGNGKERRSLTAPCDVWKMAAAAAGGFAWRLDVEAALSLGRR